MQFLKYFISVLTTTSICACSAPDSRGGYAKLEIQLSEEQQSISYYLFGNALPEATSAHTDGVAAMQIHPMVFENLKEFAAPLCSRNIDFKHFVAVNRWSSNRFDKTIYIKLNPYISDANVIAVFKEDSLQGYWVFQGIDGDVCRGVATLEFIE